MTDWGSGKETGSYGDGRSAAPGPHYPYPTAGSDTNPNAYPEAGPMTNGEIEWKSAPVSGSLTRYPTPSTAVGESGGPPSASAPYPPPPGAPTGASEYSTPAGKASYPPHPGYPQPNYPHANYPPPQYPPPQYPPAQYPPAQYPPPQYSQAGYPSTSSYGKEEAVNNRSSGYGANPGYPSGGPGYQSGEFSGYAAPTESREAALKPQSSAPVKTVSRRTGSTTAHASSEPIPKSTYAKPIPGNSRGTYYQSGDYVESQYREEPKKKNVFSSNKKAIGYGVAGAVLFGDVGGVAGALYGHHKDKKKKKKDRERSGYYY